MQRLYHVPVESQGDQVRKLLTYDLRSETIPILINPLTTGNVCQKFVFLDILVVLRLDLSQIRFNPVENVFVTQQLALPRH